MVAAHVERHRDDLLVEFHADLFLGFRDAGDAGLFTLESARNDFDDAADLDAAGNGLGLQVRQDVLKRGFTGKHALGVLEWGLVDATTGGRVSTAGPANELLNVMERTRLDEDVAAHGGRVENGHDLALERHHGTAAVKASVHLISHALLGVDGRLHDVKEGTHAAVHLTEQAVSVLHVEVGKDAVVVLDVARVDPFRSGVNP